MRNQIDVTDQLRLIKALLQRTTKWREDARTALHEVRAAIGARFDALGTLRQLQTSEAASTESADEASTGAGEGEGADGGGDDTAAAGDGDAVMGDADGGA